MTRLIGMHNSPFLETGVEISWPQYSQERQILTENVRSCFKAEARSCRADGGGSGQGRSSCQAALCPGHARVRTSSLLQARRASR